MYTLNNIYPEYIGAEGSLHHVRGDRGGARTHVHVRHAGGVHRDGQEEDAMVLITRNISASETDNPNTNSN